MTTPILVPGENCALSESDVATMNAWIADELAKEQAMTHPQPAAYMRRWF